MNTDREFDIARSDIDAENKRLIREFLETRRRRWDGALIGLPKRPPRQVPSPGEPPAQEEAYASQG